MDNHLCTADSRTTVTKDKGLFSSDPANPLNDYWYRYKLLTTDFKFMGPNGVPDQYFLEFFFLSLI